MRSQRLANATSRVDIAGPRACRQVKSDLRNLLATDPDGHHRLVQIAMLV
jgi:hypothetical protein